MNHRIVSSVVMIIFTLFVGAALLFTWAATSVAPSVSSAGYAPDNPHPPSQETDSCLDCHVVDEDTIPVTHRYYNEQTCGSCHRQAPRSFVPHSIEMGDTGCPLCHGDPSRDHGVPESHMRYETGECLLCHPVDPARALREPPPAGLSRSVTGPPLHPTDGPFATCSDCHWVEPRSTLPENHRDLSVETCTECHRNDAGEPVDGE